MGFPRFGVFVLCSSDMTQPIKTWPNVDEVVVGDEPRGQALRRRPGRAIADMRANRNPTRMRVLRALS